MSQPKVYFRLFGESPESLKDRAGDLVDSSSPPNRMRCLAPGSLLNCEYRIELSQETQVTAVETSVLWMTQGKGQEDLGVHFFERRENKMVQPEVLRQTHKLSTLLPKSPLSYDGVIVKVDWCVRVRIFLNDGSQITRDCFFRLGNVSLASLLAKESAAEPGEVDSTAPPDQKIDGGEGDVSQRPPAATGHPAQDGETDDSPI